MSPFIAALPMYDWPECRSTTDAAWSDLRGALRARGVDAPESLVRRNPEMPAVPGGIRDGSGKVIAPDPATLPPDDLDPPTLWRHPQLLFAQTCWGPMEQGLADHVRVIGQPDYSDVEGGQGAFYSSAIVMRVDAGEHIPAPSEGNAVIPVEALRGKRLAFNGQDSMSGIIGLTRDLEAMGEGIDVFSERIETGGHRASIVAVAQRRADVCAVDCRTWALAQRFEPAAAAVAVVGWTARRKGLPYIASAALPEEIVALLRDILDCAETQRRASGE